MLSSQKLINEGFSCELFNFNPQPLGNPRQNFTVMARGVILLLLASDSKLPATDEGMSVHCVIIAFPLRMAAVFKRI